MGNYIRFDWMIKRLLRNKSSFVVLEGFLSVLLDRQIKMIFVLLKTQKYVNTFTFGFLFYKSYL